jgi:hypothetical protein
MTLRREFLIFLNVLRLAATRPVNLITCALVAGIFIMIATAPKPSLVIMQEDKLRVWLIVLIILWLLFFGLYLLVRFAIALLGRRRNAVLFGCAVWAALMPVIVAVIIYNRFGYRDDDAKHALMAMIYNEKLTLLPKPDVPGTKLIDLGLNSCYPSYTGRQCWLVHVTPRLADDLDLAQDVGKWHAIKSNTLLSVLPLYMQYGTVDVRRLNESTYSVLGEEYSGR